MDKSVKNPAEEFILDLDSDYKDATHIQNNLLYIFFFHRFCSLED